MAVKTEKIDGKLILNEYDSSNIISSIYDTDNKELKVTFKGGRTYTYDGVPHKIFTKLRMSESQGKFFNQNISRNYKYKEVK
jgi:hypothetical protein